MPYRSGDTGTAWRSYELSRASEDAPSVGISCGKFHTRMVSHLTNRIFFSTRILNFKLTLGSFSDQ